jgi:hypothetical protein
MKFSVTIKIYKYKGRHEKHHFILMAIKVHGIPGWNMDHFIKECAYFFHDRWSKGHLSFFFAFNFSSDVLILFFSMI